MSARNGVQIPKRMRSLERDKRGYPIPFIVLRDKTGQPQFTINDIRRVAECRNKRLCSICGKRFDDGVWFVGGSRCFLHERGAFLDPPLHLECAEYALQVCPFLAASRYSKRIDDAKLAPGALPDQMALVREPFMNPRLPERFGLGWTHDYIFRASTNHGEGVYIANSWDYVEFWQAGNPCGPPQTGQPPPDDVVTI
jgi:hypothetical protein